MPGNNAPPPARPAEIDDDVGNRVRQESNRSPASGNEAPRSERPTEIDDNFGNR
jgi:hypothetical protein